ncbi:hypothetical protein F5Y18DRAFT_180419 [Xylariaceae sp. FL1019]|nr:hypothetical protein F5Y18DRAFT_180419 [Xylariaceae sp. FL1019]
MIGPATLSPVRRLQQGRSPSPPVHPKPITEPSLILQPWCSQPTNSVFSNPSNFSQAPSLRVLQVNSSGTSRHPSMSEVDVLELTSKAAKRSSNSAQPGLIALFVHLEPEPNASYKRQTSLSRNCFKTLVELLAIHDAAIHDAAIHDAAIHNVLERPDYYSAFGRRKKGMLDKTTAFEFYCQHPRWLQKSRHDMSRPMAPCSVYMHHDTTLKLTFYIVSTGREEIRIGDITGTLGHTDMDEPYSGPRIEAAANPFFIHAMVSGLAYKQSIDYAQDIRDRLFSQVVKVNDYSGGDHAVQPHARGSDSRRDLEHITKELHRVSQTCDAGIANANMSISLTREMLSAYSTFIPADCDAPHTWRHVEDSIDWILKTWQCQKNWLESYKARKDTAMGSVFNLVVQQDSAINIGMAHQAAYHTSSMNIITTITLIFLPGTFVAGVFGSGILDKEDQHGISDLILPFIYVFISLTLVTFGW